MIIDLLGTPQPHEMRTACDSAKRWVQKRQHRSPRMHKIYKMANQCGPHGTDLLLKMLHFDPVRPAIVHLMC